MECEQLNKYKIAVFILYRDVKLFLEAHSDAEAIGILCRV